MTDETPDPTEPPRIRWLRRRRWDAAAPGATAREAETPAALRRAEQLLQQLRDRAWRGRRARTPD